MLQRMIDIALLRRDPQRIRRIAARRTGDASFVDEVLAVDAQRRTALTLSEQLKAEKNALSASIAKATDRAAQAQRLKPEISALDARIADTANVIPELESRIEAILAEIPNLLDDCVPDGTSEGDNVVVRSSGAPPNLPFTPKPHWELGEALDILDFERAAKISRSRFSFLRAQGAQLSRAIVNFFLDRARRHGYVEISPPLLVNRATMWATGQLTKFSDAMFMDQDADLFLIPTAEVPLTALHRDEILKAEQLPLRYAAYTPCFRKEAGAAGKDTRGLIRQHQFEKVELVWVTMPETSFEALERLTADAESLLSELRLPYRVLALCSSDVGFNAAKTYDLEVWLPGQGTYREISSCSNCTDFQTRRSGIRFRRDASAKPEHAHTLNGSGLAVGRTLLAILENYQQADGSVRIPDALVPFTGFEVIEASAT